MVKLGFFKRWEMVLFALMFNLLMRLFNVKTEMLSVLVPVLLSVPVLVSFISRMSVVV